MDLNLDIEKEIFTIKNHIKEYVRKLKKTGVIVGLSGGLDSSITASLCVDALGKDKVVGVSLPEKESSQEGSDLAKELAGKLDIKFIQKDITSVLSSFNVYKEISNIIKKYYPEYNEIDNKYKMALPQNILDQKQLNIYSLSVFNNNDEEVCKKRLSFDDYSAFKAAVSIKLRTRMVYLYYYGEYFNKLIAGTTNKSEFELGNFCKYGDGGVDFEVISHLYKTQLYQLAKYIKLPEKIINRIPSPDIFSSYTSDKEFFFSLSFDILDKLLYSYKNAIPIIEIVDELNLKQEQIERVFSNFKIKQKNTYHLKEMPPSLL